MEDVLQSIARQLEARGAGARVQTGLMSRSYRCRCGNHVFFRNTLCLNCHAQLGFLPDTAQVAALDAGPRPSTWTAAGRAVVMKFCANRHSAAACNWMMLADNPMEYCIACRLNRTVPNLDDPDQIFYALTARIILRTWWNSHETVQIQYNKWIYGDEVPYNFRAPPSEALDTDALSVGCGLWW